MIRPLHVQDAAAFRDFLEHLSPASRYARFQYVVKEVTPELLHMLVVADPRSHVALAAFDDDEMIGEARLVRRGDRDEADFAIAVADSWRRRGLARRLLDRLLGTARSYRLRRVEGEVLADNAAMLAFVRQAGFDVLPHPEDGRLVLARLEIGSRVQRAPAFSRTANTARFAIGAGFG